MISLFKNEDFSPNLYFRLDLEQDASPRDVRLAYRERAHETHPDKPGNEGKEAEFVAISRAYEVLKDEQKRSMYNRELDMRAGVKSTAKTSSMADAFSSTKTRDNADPYSGIKYTEEELERYKEASARFANGNPRSGDLCAVFNFSAGAPIIRRGPAHKIDHSRKQLPEWHEEDDDDRPLLELDIN